MKSNVALILSSVYIGLLLVAVGVVSSSFVLAIASLGPFSVAASRIVRKDERENSETHAEAWGYKTYFTVIVAAISTILAAIFVI